MREKHTEVLTIKETFCRMRNNLIERVDTVLRPRVKRVAKAKGLPAEIQKCVGGMLNKHVTVFQDCPNPSR